MHDYKLQNKKKSYIQNKKMTSKLKLKSNFRALSQEKQKI